MCRHQRGCSMLCLYKYIAENPTASRPVGLALAERCRTLDMPVLGDRLAERGGAMQNAGFHVAGICILFLCLLGGVVPSTVST